MIASRVAARLRSETKSEVELRKGGLGELSVAIDGQKVVDTNRFWYPTPNSIFQRVKQILDATQAPQEQLNDRRA
ncbi:MAG TPA: hypothetical protein VLA93_08305 [Pyrinomonadaceae bacterium]|nr:hypothetical protein [Pyrinomonadaceae bacterium]